LDSKLQIHQNQPEISFQLLHSKNASRECFAWKNGPKLHLFFSNFLIIEAPASLVDFLGSFFSSESTFQFDSMLWNWVVSKGGGRFQRAKKLKHPCSWLSIFFWPN
jgi:hypothetical protein